MAASRNPRDKRNNNQQNYYYERNRTFSSTTTDHFRNKLAQIGIEKDLRELLERKRLEKDQDKNFPKTSDIPSNENAQKVIGKVKFEGETLPLRRSKSFNNEGQQNYPKTQRPYYNRFLNENNLELHQNSGKNPRIRKENFVDLYHPTNIKIELKTNTGARTCIVDPSVPISDIKCDYKKSRNVLKHVGPKEKVPPEQVSQTDRKYVNVKNPDHFRGNLGSFSRKNKENKKEFPLQNKEKDNDSNTANVVESLSKLVISERNENKAIEPH